MFGDKFKSQDGRPVLFCENRVDNASRSISAYFDLHTGFSIFDITHTLITCFIVLIYTIPPLVGYTEFNFDFP